MNILSISPDTVCVEAPRPTSNATAAWTTISPPGDGHPIMTA